MERLRRRQEVSREERRRGGVQGEKRRSCVLPLAVKVKVLMHRRGIAKTSHQHTATLGPLSHPNRAAGGAHEGG
ncbi:hypothetical protein AAFF_G00312990 [Aldrovandia affinis]|uniref:Uncharacterized protein n=1 Tax=Aldrovandia affinis TaxID=143900 RepID=A0AAD7SPN5_9TELE|nr:hypothetical protein AAFF_G00312990 [Aldrovandia affinis]